MGKNNESSTEVNMNMGILDKVDPNRNCTRLCPASLLPWGEFPRLKDARIPRREKETPPAVVALAMSVFLPGG
jgi:hypothetical protein